MSAIPTVPVPGICRTLQALRGQVAAHLHPHEGAHISTKLPQVRPTQSLGSLGPPQVPRGSL